MYILAKQYNVHVFILFAIDSTTTISLVNVPKWISVVLYYWWCVTFISFASPCYKHVIYPHLKISTTTHSITYRLSEICLKVIVRQLTNWSIAMIYTVSIRFMCASWFLIPVKPQTLYHHWLPFTAIDTQYSSIIILIRIQ